MLACILSSLLALEECPAGNRSSLGALMLTLILTVCHNHFSLMLQVIQSFNICPSSFAYYCTLVQKVLFAGGLCQYLLKVIRYANVWIYLIQFNIFSDEVILTDRVTFSKLNYTLKVNHSFK